MTALEQQKTPRPVGENVGRVDAFEKVTGAAQFADDLQFGPGLLYARVKRSPHPHAIIKQIDVSKAKALPGVKAIVTGEKYPGRIGLYLKDRHILCRERVRYIGDPLAVVAAISEEIAEKALDLIEVEYEVLEPVSDPEYGASPEAPILHPDLDKYEVVNFIFPQAGTNVSNYFKIRKGDVSKAWPQCASIIERKYRVPQVQHVPIEPHVATARVDQDGKITLWTSSQSPFAQRSLIAHTLGISEADMRVLSPYVGGGFGCKAGVSMEALAVVIAMEIPGRPVKLRLTREEEFHTAFVRQGLVHYIKMGCDKEGHILAMESRMYWDAGGYTEYGVNITRASGYSSSGPYSIPNVHTDSRCVYTNHPVGGPMRGFGMPEMHNGIEQCIDEMAQEIGMDPVEFRLKNCVKGGDIIVTGMKMHPTGLSECIRKAAEAIDWGKPAPPSAPNKKRGRGLAAMWKAPAMSPNPGSSAFVRMNEDGTATVNVGGQELGQGAFTVAAQIAAAGLGLTSDKVRVNTPLDTKYSPYEWQTVASRITWSMGNAVLNAARDARRQILEVVAEAWSEKVEDLDIIDNQVISYKSEETMPLKDLVIYGLPREGYRGWFGGPIVGRGSFMPTYVTGLDPETGQGERAVVHYTTGAQGVDLEIDTETGQVTILKVSSAFDVGRAINPKLVEAQMEGGAMQGISTALFEAMRFQQGVLQNPSFVDYRIATSADVPGEIIPLIVEVPQDDGPFGARGVGEHSMVPTMPAIANAIANALGLRVPEPPFTAEKIYLAMEDAGIAGK